MIDDHKERRRFLHVAGISGFMYELDLMTFVLRIFFRHFLLTHTSDIIILDIIICDAPNPGCPLTTRQPAKNLYVSYRETHT